MAVLIMVLSEMATGELIDEQFVKNLSDVTDYI